MKLSVGIYIQTQGSDHIDISAGAVFPRPLSYAQFFQCCWLQCWKTGRSVDWALPCLLPACSMLATASLRMHIVYRENPSIRITYGGRLCASGSGRMRIRYGDWFCAECAFSTTVLTLGAPLALGSDWWLQGPARPTLRVLCRGL